MKDHISRYIFISVAAALSLTGCGGSTTPVVPSAVSLTQTSTALKLKGILSANSSSSAWNNGQQIPTAFLDNAFRSTGPFYQSLPSNPQIDAHNSSVIGYYFYGNPAFNVGWIEGNSRQTQYDYNYPIYQASNSDPLVTISCDHRDGMCADNGTQIHLPSAAVQAGGADAHLAVIEPSGIEYDFWMVSSHPPYANNALIHASSEAHFTTDGSGNIAPGFTQRGATAGGIALSIGQIYTSELARGTINHAIALVFPCGTNNWVYPASQASAICQNGQGMPLGSRLWWAPTDAQTNALSVPNDIKTVLIAMHHYGAFYTDSGGAPSGNGKGLPVSPHLENQAPYWTYGKGIDPALQYAQTAPGWNHITTASGIDRYRLGTPGSSVDFLNNLKVLAPCVTQKTC